MCRIPYRQQLARETRDEPPKQAGEKKSQRIIHSFVEDGKESVARLLRIRRAEQAEASDD